MKRRGGANHNKRGNQTRKERSDDDIRPNKRIIFFVQTFFDNRRLHENLHKRRDGCSNQRHYCKNIRRI